MPRVERELTREGYGCYGLPKDAVNARIIVEWEEPPKNDWTPAKAALYMWNCLNMTREEIANKIAELERAKCAEVVRKRSQLWNAGASVEELMNLCADAILARTNEEAGYPRMEK